MDVTVYGFILKKLKTSVLLALVIGLILLVFQEQQVVLAYLTGFLLSAFNFLLLSVELNFLFMSSPAKARVMHFILFIIRYALIGYIVVKVIQTRNYNIFSLFGGLLTMNLSIVLSASWKQIFVRKEG